MSEFKSLQDRMEKALDALKKEFMGLRTGRAHVNLLDSIRVDLYGNLSPLNQIAAVSAPEARTLLIQVWDKGLVKKVEKAILDSDLGMNPMVDGQNIRLNLPDLSEERRKELAKMAAKYAELSRISVRNIRRDGMEDLKKQEKDGALSKDDVHRQGESIQKLTDEVIKKIDDLLLHKEQDIMKV